MPGHYRKRPVPMATASNIEALLRTMQADIEVYGSEAVKQRRRTLLRGFRAGLWAAQAGKPKLGEIAQVLRAELFGHPLALVATDDDELCHTGTPTEDE